MTLKVLFGKRIKKLRESMLLSQEALAEKIGIHRNTLARIENGINFASLETIENLCRVFNLEYKDLFTFNQVVKKEPTKAFLLKLAELNDNDATYFLKNIDAYIEAKHKNSKT